MKTLKIKNFLFGLTTLLFIAMVISSCQQTEEVHADLQETVDNNYEIENRRAKIQVQTPCWINGPSSFPHGETATFTANAVFGAQYFWSVPDCFTIVPDSNPMDNSITISSAGGCVGQISVYICVNGAQPPNPTYCSYCYVNDVTCNPPPCEKTVDVLIIHEPCYDDESSSFEQRGKYGVHLVEDCDVAVASYAWTVDDGNITGNATSGSVWFQPDASCYLQYITMTVTVTFADGDVVTGSAVSFVGDCW